MSRNNNPQNETLISPEPPQQPPQTTTKPNPKFLSILLQALIMTLIISLFFIFIGVAAIIFIHLCVVGGALHRRRHLRRRGGLPPSSTAAALPAVARSNSAEVCAICLENVEIGELIRVLMSCDHVFHVDCVDRWLVRVNACPTCRRTVAVENCDRDRAAVFDWERLWLSCA